MKGRPGLAVAISVSQGISMLGFACKKGKVLIVDEESGKRLLSFRMKKLISGHGGEHDIHFMSEQGFTLSEPRSMAKFKEFMGNLQPDLVIFDSLRRIHTTSESSSDDMAKVTGALQHLMRYHECAICIIHHDCKLVGSDRKNAYRGSTEIQAVLDSHLAISRVSPGEDTFRVEQVKSRYAAAIDPFYFELVDINSDSTVVRLADAPEAAPRRDQEVREFYRDRLSDGEVHLRRDIQASGQGLGYGKNILDDVRSELVAEGVVVEVRRGSAKGFQLSSCSPDPIEEEDDQQTESVDPMELRA